MPQISRGKTAENERKYPYVVAIAVVGKGLDIGLSRRIVDFHNARHVELRHGRTQASTEGETVYRWFFSDLEAAHAFIENFGGSLRERKDTYVPVGRSGVRPKARREKEAAVRRMRILHAVLFETARLRTEGAIEPHGEAVQKIAHQENIQVDTAERYCRAARELMKSIRARSLPLYEDISAYVDDVERLLSQK
jgi:hypothetical protein